MAERIEAAQRRHAWLVAEQGGRVVGYAYGGPFRVREAYRWTCEVSIYLDRDRRGAPLGRELYQGLLARLVTLGYHVAVAGMTLPNPASVRLHEALGFTPVGTFRRVGWKAGVWRDVAWMQRELAPATDWPGDPG